jgi:AcrR family transcriptional regulator
MARPSTRQKLLDCAENLFANQGLAGVSLRSINASAGLSPAALHYHFGSKDALVAALLERRMPSLMERRRELFDALEGTNATVGVRNILEALVQPMIELLEQDQQDGHRYLRFIYRLQVDGDLFPLFPTDKLGGGVDRLVPMLCLAMPDIPLEVVQVRLALAIDVMLRSLALTPPTVAADLGAQMRRLVDFLTGALEAECTEAAA